ncbi:hypothetical protein L228DRAFT_171363 [Xylona heveae TC161]|uniref:Multiple myeloma tumor-associated protein 2-like N-terminal domain-containing protein n=1 Tax=Xylona heveae (strain CBS 132557 / TC161) TaxID=1328760 RepID=A0A165FU13_XYLHT|nr:hypothetical protein L228DRAFT_171363 [Xylona heveae TC161]KZF21380.1 hypothetical protein L228DRAFT_171363 [Xylona heveae TC161]
MDLVASVRKEGSRGGRGEFKWEDVQGSTRRENYLGHSLMAPVGRWQQGRDLSWYAKSGAPNADADAEASSAADARAEEIRRVKEAEQDALAAALGFAPTPRRLDSGGGASRAEIEKAVQETTADDDEGAGAAADKVDRKGRYDVDIDNAEGGGRGVGYGGFGGRQIGPVGDSDTLGGEGVGLARGGILGGESGGERRARHSRRGEREREDDYGREDRHRRRRKEERRERERDRVRGYDRGFDRERGRDRSHERRRDRRRERSREDRHHRHEQHHRRHGRSRSRSRSRDKRERSPGDRATSPRGDRRRDRDDTYGDRRGAYRGSERRRYSDDRYGDDDRRRR